MAQEVGCLAHYAETRDSVIEFDQEGNYLGTIVEPGQDGMDDPWFLAFREHDLLVAANLTDRVHSFSHDGARVPRSATDPEAGRGTWRRRVPDPTVGRATWRRRVPSS